MKTRTTVISRFFDSAAHAQKVRFELLYRQRFNRRIVSYFDSADGLVEAMAKAKADPATAEAYAAKLAGGNGAVLMVEAGYKPLAAAKLTRTIFADMGATATEGLTEEVVYDTPHNPNRSVLDGAPLMMSRPRDPMATNFHMADWPIGLISRRKPTTASVIKPHAYMANAILPHISRRKPNTNSIFERHARMANFPIPLISKRKPYNEMMIPRHGRMANMILPLTNRRKPYTGSIIARHARMANWPFPHLINGKRGTNSLMPGAPRMANWPISLLSDRKPYTGSIVPRHGRMAAFPIPLLSDRKPYTGSAIEPHARMADMILPLVVRREDTGNPEAGGRARGSFSRFFGWPTIIRK